MAYHFTLSPTEPIAFQWARRHGRGMPVNQRRNVGRTLRAWHAN